MKTFSGRNASQNEFELSSFIDFLKGKNVEKYLEIGARHGDTFHNIMSSLPVGSFGLAVDLPGALWGNHKSRNSLRDAVNDLVKKGYDCQYLFADSRAAETIQYVWTLRDFDAALIDGDHTLEGVTADWENYMGIAPYIAFHDIVGTGQIEKVHQNAVEVPILWAEIKQTHQVVEFIDNDSKMGIGIVCLP